MKLPRCHRSHGGRVSLADFQRAFARAVAHPAVWQARLARAPDLTTTETPTFDGLDLTPREVERLRRLLRHERLKAHQVMLRSTRAMPLHSALPLTCDWLEHETPAAFDAWLAESADASIHYGRETERFAAWLPAFLTRTGVENHPALDALRFERALAVLVSQFASGRTEATVAVSWGYAPSDVLGGWRAHVAPLPFRASARLCVVDGEVILEPEPAPHP